MVRVREYMAQEAIAVLDKKVMAGVVWMMSVMWNIYPSTVSILASPFCIIRRFTIGRALPS